ncbi:hypothetical protein OGR47_12060 [Methylocystis sp. MJC1]|jgi:hypothetical protein|uniref:hypothetical protein n=1 Tax=Methylocystis sp. MJC1 TaxID=2654282 RepID=UPI0013E9C7D8|nr:hypothetical protein [Methylocystis sp. MJC1]KAF2990818.1 hypothetical protein MJC1_01915 [Methylocystis sp. MJC1]MBU6527713.1 hypothetical protein [Methylocystis sp. MJC1]UZX10649.1 hypothetical protein OGR47_12060 [Methylocystis sp. MJC1]
MPFNHNTLLWCCHVRGPDDLYAAKDYEEARQMADDLNFLFAPRKGVERHEFDPIIIAAPMVWPGTRDEHAKDLIRLMGERVRFAQRGRK